MKSWRTGSRERECGETAPKDRRVFTATQPAAMIVRTGRRGTFCARNGRFVDPAPSRPGPRGRSPAPIPRDSTMRTIPAPHARILAMLMLLAACDSTTPPGGGDFLATLSSPNGGEGAVAVQLTGGGIEEISASSGTLFSRVQGNS